MNVDNGGSNLAGMLTKAKENCCSALMGDDTELACAGAALGGGFTNANELHVLACDEAMKQPGKDEWKESVETEPQRMQEHGAFKPVPRKEVEAAGEKIAASAWSMKKKSSGVC